MNIADGVYNATITAAAVYEKNGLKLELHLSLCDENGNGYTQIGSDGKEYPLEKRMFYTLISNEGAVNTKVIEFIKAWAPAWDGVDPFWFTDVANTDAIGMVECTLKTEPDYKDPKKSYQNVKFINELGHAANHGGGSKPVQSGDRAAIMAKYGAKFKAAAQATMKPVAASALKKPAPVAAKPAPAAPSRPSPKPAPVAPKNTRSYQDGLAGQAEVWDAYCKEHPGDSQDALSTAWFAALDEIAPGKDQADLTGAEWNSVAEKLQIMPF